MSGPIAFLNGRIIPGAQAAVPVSDAGFVLGMTVAEQLRTFGGRLFRLEQHLERLFHSLDVIGVQPPLGRTEFIEQATEVARHNHALLAAGDDLGMTIFVTPGPYPTMVAGSGESETGMAPGELGPGESSRAQPSSGPTVCMHTFPVPFRLWADKYEQGESLVTTSIEQVSPRSWPPELKCRSRMHYYLADREARAKQPGARALMLDEHGNVTEATTANIVLYREGVGLITPPRAKVLPGISLAVLRELAESLKIVVVEQDLTPADVSGAQEVLLTSTSPCVLPVVSFNGKPIGGGRPGQGFRRLLGAWSGLVGVDIAEQAKKFAKR